jgi:LEA14-like dessication related protein
MPAQPSLLVYEQHPRGLGRAGSLLLPLLMLSLSTGCATLRPDFEQPSVDVVSVRALPSGDLLPNFEIGLRVVNPNATELKLRGVSYKLLLNDYEVVKGVASELPVVPAYGEAQFTLLASVSLIDSFGLVNDLMRQSRGDLNWRLLAKLDIGALLPAILVEEKGTLTTSPAK